MRLVIKNEKEFKGGIIACTQRAGILVQCATGYPVPVPVPANPANIFQSGSGSGSGQILAGLAGFLKIIQKFSKMLKM